MSSLCCLQLFFGLLCVLIHNYVAGLEITFVNEYTTPGQIFVGGRVRARFHHPNQPAVKVNPTSFFLPNNVAGQNNTKTISLPDDWVGEFWTGTDCNPKTYQCVSGTCPKSPKCTSLPRHDLTFITFVAQPEHNRMKYFIRNTYGINHVYRVEAINGKGPKCGPIQCDYDENAKCPAGFNVGHGKNDRIFYGCKTPCSALNYKDACCRFGKCGKYNRDIPVFRKLCPDAIYTENDKHFNLCTSNKFKIIIGKPSKS